MTVLAGSAYYRLMETKGEQSTQLALLTVSRALVKATRPKQWSKNLLVYFALFFTVAETWDVGDVGPALSLLGKTTTAFVLFSMLSGAVYIVNDIFDVERDRRHQVKRRRPIASGQLGVPAAWVAGKVGRRLGARVSMCNRHGYGRVGVKVPFEGHLVVIRPVRGGRQLRGLIHA